MLLFEKINEVFFMVKPEKPCDFVDLQELWYGFKFEHPDKHFMPRYKNGVWDGSVKFIRYIDKFKELALVPIGLFHEIYNFMISKNIPFKVLNNDIGVIKVDFDDFDEWLQINESEKAKKISNREYQYATVKCALYLNRGILKSPTGSGKSLMIYMYMKWILDHDYKEGDKFLILVPNTNLVNQMTKDFVEYGCPRNAICKIYSGQKKDLSKPIIISTWQSLYLEDYNFFDQFTAIVFDECHKAKAEEQIYIGENCVNARWRLATSATIQKDKVHQYSIMQNFGEIFESAKTRELIDDGFLCDFQVRNIVMNWKNPNGKTMKIEAENFAEEYDAIINNETRTENVFNFVMNLWENRDLEKGTILVLGKRISFIEALYSKMAEHTNDAFFIHGQIPVKEREKVLDYIKKHGGILIGNIDIMGTGINIPNVTSIVFANPIKSEILLLQTIGRAIRLHDNKNYAIIYDLIDKMKLANGSTNTVFSWLDDKKRVYIEHEYKYDTIEIDLKHN